MTKSMFDRMWAKVDIREWEADPHGHWWWTASTTAQRPSAPDGYGRINTTRQRTQQTTYAHRYFYELLVGPIPTGYTIDHLCRVTICVNPDHLEAVTYQQNTLRSKTALAAVNARKTHCKRGHPLSGDNLSRRQKGRNCLTCARERMRAYNAQLPGR